MKIDNLRKEFDLSQAKVNLKNSFDFNAKKSESQEKNQTQIKTNKVIMLYETSNKLFQKIPKCDLIQSRAFNKNNNSIKLQPTIPQKKSYDNVNRNNNNQDLKPQNLQLKICNSLKLFHNKSNTHYNTMAIWPEPKEKHSNNKLTNTSNANNITSKHSNTPSTIQSTDDYRTHLIPNQNDYKQKDTLITRLNTVISNQYIKIDELDAQIKYLNSKYKKIKEEKNTLQGECLSYQNDLLKLKGENEALKQHQLKLMKVMYMLKDKGIEIESYINKIFQGKSNLYCGDNINVNDSLESITFPDKIDYTNATTTFDDMASKGVPKLNFDKVYLYQKAFIEQEDAKHNHQNQNKDEYKDLKTEETYMKPKIQYMIRMQNNKDKGRSHSIKNNNYTNDMQDNEKNKKKIILKKK